MFALGSSHRFYLYDGHCDMRKSFDGLCLCQEVLSKMEEQTLKKKVCGTPTTLFRRSCQTTLRCFSCEREVVNGQRKALIKITQVCIRKVNASELLKK